MLIASTYKALLPGTTKAYALVANLTGNDAQNFNAARVEAFASFTARRKRHGTDLRSSVIDMPVSAGTQDVQQQIASMCSFFGVDDDGNSDVETGNSDGETGNGDEEDL